MAIASLAENPTWSVEVTDLMVPDLAKSLPSSSGAHAVIAVLSSLRQNYFFEEL